ncbi:MAG TPA: FkbM family methyltransferase, partial [Kofleriaceae bacterium]|nr:FkbM family methyltransferase [Kofleriaceae bacterium]
DGGMNIGQTLLKVASIDAERRYLGFEPNPLCYFTCKEIVAANQLRASEIFPVGLSDRTQLLPLFMDTDYAPGASVLEHFREDTKRFHQRVNVALFRGDEVVAIRRERAIAVVKIDVEGAELEVVRGLHDTISRARPHIVLEILPVYSLGKPNGRYRKERQDALVSALGDLGYRMFLIRERERRFELLADIPVHGDMSRTNYLFVHRDVTGEIDLERNPSFRALA